MSRKKTRLQSVTEAAQIHRDACGIDISPEVIYVAVGPQQDAPAVRRLECLRQSCTGPRLVESVRGPNDCSGIDGGLLDSFVSGAGRSRV